VDVLIGLLPSVNKVRIENSKKDKQQRNMYNQQMNLPTGNSSSDTKELDNKIKIKQVFWDGPERRSSRERRHLKNKRGRWLESRDRNDRRTSRYGISVKI
jgi:hypothetical protein